METKTINRFVKLIIASCLFIQSTLSAECTYEQSLKADEFPIGIRLSWSTSSEKNTSMFIIEKLDNTSVFQPVGTIKASENSRTIIDYKFLDNRVMSQTHSYRIKQMDIDGTFSYSDVVTVHKKIEVNSMLVQSFDKTVKNSYDFILEAAKSGMANIQLIDSDDNIAWQGVKEVSKGLNNMAIDLSAQSEGVYKVIILMERDERVLTIRKASDEIERASNVANIKKTSRN